MKEYLADRIRGLASPVARNVAREYLQARILGSLQRSGSMISLAFQGGTALRFLYSIHRYSEDLDFAKAGVDALTLSEFSPYLPPMATAANPVRGASPAERRR